MRQSAYPGQLTSSGSSRVVVRSTIREEVVAPSPLGRAQRHFTSMVKCVLIGPVLGKLCHPDRYSELWQSIRAALVESFTQALYDEDIVMAASAGNQRLYLLRKRGLVVVRQADGIMEGLLRRQRAEWSDAAFLDLVLRA